MKPTAKIESNLGKTDSLAPILELRSTNTEFNQAALRIVQNSVKGAAASIRIEDPNPDIEFIETSSDPVDPTDKGKGRYEIAVQSDKLQINGRNTTNDGFETVAVFQRLAVGGNFGFRTTSQFGSGKGVIGIANANAVPSKNPREGGILYVENGALKYRGSNGTVTVLAPA